MLRTCETAMLQNMIKMERPTKVDSFDNTGTESRSAGRELTLLET
jgi:hypothetical protein